MTQGTVTNLAWSRQDYLAAVIKALGDEEGDYGYEDPKAALAEIPDIQRLDFETQEGRVQIKAGEPHPGNAQLMIFALFPGESQLDVMIYAYPVGPADPTSKAWLRYTTNRATGQIAQLLEGMPRATFIDELAAEYDSLLDDGEEEPGGEGEPEEEETPEAAPDAPTSPATPSALV
jgi:hypothetical protein